MSTLLGLSRSGANGSAWSGGVGLDAVDNPVVDARTGAKTATLAFKGGLFYDRDGSLLFSILGGSRRDVARLTINFYPGTLNVARTALDSGSSFRTMEPHDSGSQPGRHRVRRLTGTRALATRTMRALSPPRQNTTGFATVIGERPRVVARALNAGSSVVRIL